MPRKRKKIIHVNQHVIKANLKTGERNPVLTIKEGKTNTYAHEVAILDAMGREIARVVYRPHAPLSCGARVWIETHAEIRKVTHDYTGCTNTLGQAVRRVCRLDTGEVIGEIPATYQPETATLLDPTPTELSPPDVVNEYLKDDNLG